MYESALEILNTIENNGYKAYIVGGFVRDRYLLRESCDVDICTNALPIDLVKIFKNSKLPKEKYGSVTIFSNKYRFEITTFRKELKYQDRKPIEITYIDDLKDDLKRRDFTINSLCIDKNGNIIDYFNGINDIKNKIIKVLDDIDKKLTEDPLRMLRAIRFATILNFKLDKALEEKIKEYAYLVKTISYDRKKDELDKIFSSVNNKYGIKLLKDLKLDYYLNLNLKNIKLTKDILGIWAQADEGYYKFTKNEKNIIDSINKIVLNKSINKIDIYRNGLYISTIAAEILGINKNVVIKLDRSLKIHDKHNINISYEDIINIINKKPGKWIKDVYNDIEEKIINNKLKNTNYDIKDYIIKNYI